jgi:hypothetical protein
VQQGFVFHDQTLNHVEFDNSEILDVVQKEQLEKTESRFWMIL